MSPVCRDDERGEGPPPQQRHLHQVVLEYLLDDQFKERYPTSVNHVHPNDVFFATYALSIEVLLAVQCFVYGRNKGMRVSWPCVGLVGASVLAVGVACVLAGVGVLWWLDVFYLMSYLKLVITPLKYIPQVYVIYRVKSTRGFSIAGAAMDFMGGLMSLGQMFLLSANSGEYRPWLVPTPRQRAL
ncbi:Cystinosin [Chionoecetes opilio]|uniref:Cystinosin n=1 Tax=Chionoecetes opilio TaxID=41210 RepID=A0A8J4XMU6_CHIOP|nr:Cystinosin [Chionoecetes opilio]